MNTPSRSAASLFVALFVALVVLIALPRLAAAQTQTPALRLRVAASVGEGAGFEAGLGLSMSVNAPLVAGLSVMPFALLRGGASGNPLGLIVQGMFLFGGISCIGAGIGDLVGGILLYRSGARRQPLAGPSLEAYEAGRLKGTALGLGLHGGVFTALGAGLVAVARGKGGDSSLRESRVLEVAAYVSLGVGVAQLVTGALLAYGGFRNAGRVFESVAIAPSFGADGSAGAVLAGRF